MSEEGARPWLFDARHLLLVDLEATCDASGFEPAAMEIIEIGAVMVRVGDWTAVAEFQTFVRPRERPQLSDFCRQLTSITQAEVDEAPGFPRALASFADWYREWEPEVWASWGVYDLTQFRRELRRFEIPSPLPTRHLNLKSRYAETRAPGKRRPGMQAALQAEKITFAGRPHRGIDDARNLLPLLPLIFD
jgi:inhibitor of KinA sporulation pathway (predicted exonuclease)